MNGSFLHTPFLNLIVAFLTTLLISGCGDVWNNPHPRAERGKNILYSAFTEPPKHLDPVQSYTDNESILLYQIYEPPLQYHYLKRPYVLIPGSAAALPRVTLYDAQGNELPENAPASRITRSVYHITIQPGILYQPHPAFAKRPDGTPRYIPLSSDDLSPARQITDFSETGTRELTADDFVYQIKRLAHPRLHSPIFDMIAQYIPGLKTLHAQLEEAAKHDTGWLDLDQYTLPGIEVIDKYTYTITLQGTYPQFQYWLSMQFFAPVPREADQFFGQSGMADRNFTLDAWPIGTGPYMLVENNPNARMRMIRNPNFRGELFPCEGAPGDAEAGFLDDCGKPVPFIDEIIFTREREGIPYWNKFLQGYYDLSGISSDNFDQAINFDQGGGVSLSANMADRGIRLSTAVSPSIFYLGFNMLDPVVGGGTSRHSQEQARKLRQAVSIAFDTEEFISIFLNGRGIPAMHPIPPGLFGARTGKADMNPVVYTWQNGEAHRRSIDEAKKLLAEAGYPNGRHAVTGEPLILYLDTTSGGLGDKATVDWMTRQFRRLGVQFVARTTDWNRLQDKMLRGQAQLFFLGWTADYPDPESMLALLYSPQGKANFQGQNAANYSNPEYDRLFEQMKSMPNTPERQAIINRMIAILQQDAPWVFGFYPMAYTLRHGWVHNVQTSRIINNTLKYRRLDIETRSQRRAEWNQPMLWPLGLSLLLGLFIIMPAVREWRIREKTNAYGQTVQREKSC